jgi:hypothetical protein
LTAERFLVQLWENKETGATVGVDERIQTGAVRMGAGNISADYGILYSEGMMGI